MNSFNDYPVTRTALMNAKIELNQLMNRSQRRADIGVFMDRGANEKRELHNRPSVRISRTGLRRRRFRTGTVNKQEQSDSATPGTMAVVSNTWLGNKHTSSNDEDTFGKENDCAMINLDIRHQQQ